MKETPPKFSFKELCSIVDLPDRTLRSYLELGVVDRPEGPKKVAYYTQKHVDQILYAKKLRQSKMPWDMIKKLTEAEKSGESYILPKKREPGDVEVWSHIFIKDGVVLQIDPKQSGLSHEKIKEIYQTVQKMAEP